MQAARSCNVAQLCEGESCLAYSLSHTPWRYCQTSCFRRYLCIITKEVRVLKTVSGISRGQYSKTVCFSCRSFIGTLAYRWPLGTPKAEDQQTPSVLHQRHWEHHVSNLVVLLGCHSASRAYLSRIDTTTTTTTSYHNTLSGRWTNHQCAYGGFSFADYSKHHKPHSAMTLETPEA